MTKYEPEVTTRVPVEIAIACYPGAQATCVHGLTDLFMYADHFARSHCTALPPSTPRPANATDRPFLHITHWQPGAVGSDLEGTGSIGEVARSTPALAIVPASQLGPTASRHSPATTAWIARRHAEGATIAADCGGVFLVAETGLLDGRRATTHWMFADELQRRFPRLNVEGDRLVIDDVDILTAGGVLAWADLGLTIVERLLGRTVMRSTAQFMLVEPPGREQRYYGEFTPPLRHGDARILAVQHWLQAEPCAAHSIEALADRAALGRRTFLRRFVKATGLKPSDYQQRLRVARGREWLEFSTRSVEQIAVAVGYDDAGAFRRSFKRVVGLTPLEFRRRFQRPSIAAAHPSPLEPRSPPKSPSSSAAEHTPRLPSSTSPPASAA